MAKTITLPSNVEAERACLGSMLLDAEAVAIGTSSLTEDSFSNVEPRNKLVFRAIASLSEKRSPVDPQTVHDELVNLKLDQEAGSPEYLMTCIDASVSPDNIDFYIKSVRDQASLRNLLLTMQEINDDYAENGVSDISDFIANASNKIQAVSSSRQVGDFKSAGEVAQAVVNKIESAKATEVRDVTGVDTGYSKINALTHGWQKEDLIIVAARPSMGKTALTMNFAMNAAKSGKTVAFFSLEMSSMLIMQRMLANKASVSNDSIQTGHISELEKTKLASAVSQIQNMNLYIDDTANSKLGDIMAKATKLKAQHDDLALVVIDYLGRISTGDNSKNKNESREREVSIISGSLKTLARQLHVPVIVVCQLNRGAEQTESKRPMLSNLRESGSIEQDADLVLLLYRPDYYAGYGKKKKSNSPNPQPGSMEDMADESIKNTLKGEGDNSIMEVIVAKNRNGKTGSVNLIFEKAYSRFSNTSNEFDDSWANYMAKQSAGFDE
ncbi:MAG: replicative DNA helicase [Bacillota bacterium]|nr:replicative DNA helicase [Bacillota bacterium]